MALSILTRFLFYRLLISSWSPWASLSFSVAGGSSASKQLILGHGPQRTTSMCHFSKVALQRESVSPPLSSPMSARPRRKHLSAIVSDHIRLPRNRQFRRRHRRRSRAGARTTTLGRARSASRQLLHHPSQFPRQAFPLGCHP